MSKRWNGIWRISSRGGVIAGAVPDPGARFRGHIYGVLYNVCLGGGGWSSSTNGIYGLFLYFHTQILNPGNSDGRAYGFPLRGLSE